MSKYTIRIERIRAECKEGRCGHVHEIPITFKQKQIVCADLNCREVDVSLIKHIFVPYDGSAFSTRAFEFALDLASKYGSSITVGTVMSSSFFDGSFLDAQEPNKRIIDKEKLTVMEKHFEKIQNLSKKFMIPIKTEAFISSSVSDSLVTFANSNKVDLIVMGTRGK
ncbi:MAG: universal stress protein, partial [Thaumarchaeota archaeon]|nr:universal stress protein [Nitrososphaerota archaeon]